jgi:hypothetical protein
VISNASRVPAHGAAAGFIGVNRDRRNPPQELGFNRDYWLTRVRGTAWSAAYSIQFEIGVFSEASIGNVGRKPETVGWVDHVVTPLGGFGVIMAEDALDRYAVKWFERRTTNGVWRAVVRCALNPARAMANVAAARAPWYRDSRR